MRNPAGQSSDDKRVTHTEGMMDLWHPFHDAGLEVRCRKIARTATSVDTYIEQRGLDWRTVLITLDQK